MSVQSVVEGRLFFKTDKQSQADYVARGMGPFTYESRGKVLTMSYHEVPPDVLENREELTVWARRAINRHHGRESPKTLHRDKADYTAFSSFKTGANCRLNRTSRAPPSV